MSPSPSCARGPSSPPCSTPDAGSTRPCGLWCGLAWINGVSTRKVDHLVKALGCESGISKSEVSRVCSGIDTSVHAFLTRPLDATWYPYVFLDATFVHTRDSGRVVSNAVVVATGVSAQGHRAILGMDVGDTESGGFVVRVPALPTRQGPHHPHPQ